MQNDQNSNPHLRRRMSYIDALRGMACFWVLFHHFLEHKKADDGWFYYPFKLFVYIANTGWLGVSLFLVLSGFCLTYPLAIKYNVSELQLNKKEFFQRRLQRILPPYYAAMLLSLAVPYFKNVVKNRSLDDIAHVFPLKQLAFDIFAHVFMLHNFFVATFASINGAFWSLALEVQLYLIFPILLWIAKKRGLWTILCLTLVISIAWQLYAFSQQGLFIYWTREIATVYHPLPARCFEFALGMFAAYLVARPVPNQTRYAVYIAGILILPLSYFVLAISRFGPGLDSLWGIFFACVLIVLCRIPESKFNDNKLLRYLTWFGGISYSVYLIHQPVFSFMRLNRVDNDVLMVALVLVRIAITTVIAYGFYLAFEKPFMKKKVPKPIAQP